MHSNMINNEISLNFVYNSISSVPISYLYHSLHNWYHLIVLNFKFTFLNAISDFHGRASWRLPYFVMWSNDVEYDWTFTRDFLSGKVEDSRMAERGMYFMIRISFCIKYRVYSCKLYSSYYVLNDICVILTVKPEGHARVTKHGYVMSCPTFIIDPECPRFACNGREIFKYLNASWFIQQYIMSFCSTLHML